MNSPESIRIQVDATNPGQFFACCGLLELANRAWPGAIGWFTEQDFCIASEGNLQQLIDKISNVELKDLDPDNSTSTAIQMGEPFNLRLDWWQDTNAGGRELKVWAGTMESGRIARAMQATLRQPEFRRPDLFDIGTVAYDPDNPAKKVEPYYFDARRGPNAHSRDVGFSANELKLTTTASPAVELLCLVGLQRALPARIKPRIFDYHTWSVPLPPELVPAATVGQLSQAKLNQYRFENWYRTGQKKHKAFLSAIPNPGGDHE